MRAYRRWLYLSWLTLVVVVLATVSFNYCVDPYAIYGAINIPGVNANKNVATGHSRLIKPYLLRKLQPKGVILGSSRAEVGLDPGHSGWGEVQPVYNYAFGGISITELANRFQEAVEIAPVERALIGLDFYMFNAYLGDATETYRLKHDYQLYAKTLLTIDAVKASIESLRKNDPVEDPGLLPTGQIAWTFNDRRVRKYGHKNGFLRFEKHFMEDSIFPLPHKKYAFVAAETKTDAFTHFRRILQIARDNRVDLRLFISPVHARLLMVMRQNGLWDEYRQWKRTLVNILAEEALAHPGQPAFALHDFSGVNAVTSEDVPAQGDKQSRMTYYWEASHYKKETGDLIQARIFLQNDSAQPGFGRVIDTANIEDVIAETEVKFDAYVATHRADLHEIEKMKSESTWLRDKTP